jgi:hypothetical protein
MKSAYMVFVGQPEGKRPFERPRRRWEFNIRTDRRETAWAGVDWIHLAQDRDRWRALVKMVNEPSGSVKRLGISRLAE